jgi:predicted MPP superfamily phosphohydrolase
MNRTLIVLAIIAALLILAQWYVFICIRQYLCQRYSTVTGRVAYSVLAAIGLCNFLFIKLSLGSDIFPSDSFAQKVAAIVFFTYLGCVLLLCLFFSLLQLFSTVLDVKAYLGRMIGPRTGSSSETTTSEAAPLSQVAGAHEQLIRDSLSVGCKRESIPTPEERALATPSDSGLPDPSRRSFLKWGAAAGLTATVILAGRGIGQAYGTPIIEEFEFPGPFVEGLTGRLTLVHITDFHFGMFFGVPELEKLVQRVNAIDADLLVITGDIFNSPLSPMEDAVPILTRLKQRPHGNFAVLGNHDFYAGVGRAVQNIEKSGLILLRNRWVSLRTENAQLHLGGIDDPLGNWIWGGEFPNFPLFMSRAPRGRGLRILLSHRPSVLPAASAAGIDLVLSGHIHGGQIILPVPGSEKGLSLAGVVSPYTHGWYTSGTSKMYLNRGIGLTFVPWRINCPPEIAVFKLALQGSS